MTAGYSALFSAGLLAPSHVYGGNNLPKTPSKADLKCNTTVDSLPVPYGDTSPIRPLSPLPVVTKSGPPDSDISDIDLDSSDAEMDDISKRDITPTQQSVLRASTSSNTSTSSNGSVHGQPPAGNGAPRLRKRRSSLSLSISVSPMNAIRSPIRTANAALQLQRHLGSRSRSGSLVSSSVPPTATDNVFAVPGGMSAKETTSLMGRLRSGSVGSTLGRPPTSVGMAGAVPGRIIRRHVRRTTTVPAPMPPPTAPLPALPPLPPNTNIMTPKNSNHNDQVRSLYAHRQPFTSQTNSSKTAEHHHQPQRTFGNTKYPTTRDRGLSVSSTLSVGRIDEEMKEN
ncbi:hypothetical protein CC1G_03964 [Coprinopsis cinerea okayama7|uniref:Uncharacterized protein n=1 Tax=Coprinopsis cinerea (strain Okayama-7 / 130 / ATCC MYA-4618 / FGSC 9003) TaxID=240176 RepID=A8N8B7_COPC7|nr:hypothetical protein CC1G_03964 [Coprinopsis cinerea okayama7\|eukprot:XP_001831073.2 hypothetical protein CC1G_03964 [Coprinopsis cinerea okayama7\